MVLAIDGSSTNTGWAVFTNNGKLKEHGVINATDLPDLEKIDKKTPKAFRPKIRKKNMELRLAFMEEEISKIFKRYHNRISDVYMEDTYYGSDPNTLKYLSRFQGYVKAMADFENASMEFVAPTLWRRILKMHQYGKKRPELKRLSKEYVKDKIGLSLTDDETDAICIGFAMINGDV